MNALKWLLIPVAVIFIMSLVSNIDNKEPEFVFTETKQIYAKENIVIKATNVRIVFDETSDIITYSNIYEVKATKNYIEFNSTSIRGLAENIIVIGTKNELKEIRINGTSVNIEGSIKCELFDISATGIVFNGKVDSSILNISSSALKIEGTLNSKEIFISSVGIDLDINLDDFYTINIESLALEGKIRLLNSWEGNRFLNLQSSAGNITIFEPVFNRGYLNINKYNNLKINIIKY